VNLGSGSSKRRVFSDAEFAKLGKYTCFRCDNFGYCPHCKKFECAKGLPLTEGSCKFFVRNVHVRV